jgi:hypothetical protein
VGGGRWFCKLCSSVAWVVRGQWAWVWCGGHPVGPHASYQKVDPPCGARFTFPAPDLALVAGGCVRGWMDWGQPLADGGSHDIGDAAASFSFLKATSRFIPSLHVLPISGENPKLGGPPPSHTRWRRRLEIAEWLAISAVVGCILDVCSWQLGLVCCGRCCGQR